MGNAKYDYFDRHFDVDGMLYETAKWLGEQVNLSTREFVEIAEQLDLRQEDWTTFWGMIRGIEDKSERNVEIFIYERDEKLTDKDFRILKSVLGEPKEKSNCCCADVDVHNDLDHTSRCMECGEGCGIVYIF
jgi:hypothetical protein